MRREVVWTGEVDLARREQLSVELVDAVREDVVRSVTVDLAGVTFIDATGLNVLNHARNTADTSGTTFALQSPSAVVRRVLVLSGLHEAFTIV